MGIPISDSTKPQGMKWRNRMEPGQKREVMMFHLPLSKAILTMPFTESRQ